MHIHVSLVRKCASVAQGFLFAGALITTASAQVVYEADLSVTGPAIRQPMDTISEFWPTSPQPGYRERNPYVKYFCLWNCFGSDPTQPERELYEENGSGQAIYHFDRLTVHVDAILREGMIPFLVLGSCPLAMATQPYRVSYQMGVLTTSPKAASYDKYRTFVKDLFLHLNSKYGAQAVASWKYRLISEPDCTCWWTEGFDAYFKFYDYTVSGAHEANPDVRVMPGNFLQSMEWAIPYARRVQTGTFAVPGESRPYAPTRFAFTFYNPWLMGTATSPELFARMTGTVRGMFVPFPLFDNIPFAVEEGFVGKDENNKDMWSRIDGTEWGGPHFAGLCEVMIKLGYLDGVLWNPDMHNCPTPVRHVINWISSMEGSKLLPTTLVSGSMAPDHSATLTAGLRGPNSVVALIGHGHKDRTGKGNQDFLVRFKGVQPGTYRVSRQRVDATHGNYRPQWLVDSQGYSHGTGSKYDQDPFSGLPAGSPAHQIWQQNFSTYQRMAFDTDFGSSLIDATEGVLEVPLDLPPHAVEFLDIEHVGTSAGTGVGFNNLAKYQPFGTGCSAVGPQPRLAAQPGSAPRTGSTFKTEIGQLAVGSQPFMFLGFSKTSWSGLPLPFPLDLLGLPGCLLYSSGEVVFPLVNNGGAASWSLPIPANSQLHGAHFYNQVLVLGAAFQPMAVSNAADATIGQ